jgi:hypothetical protein
MILKINKKDLTHIKKMKYENKVITFTCSKDSKHNSIHAHFIKLCKHGKQQNNSSEEGYRLKKRVTNLERMQN